MKAVTIQINDLFEFEGLPVPAQRPDNSAVEAMARRQFEFLRQPLQVEIGERTVTVSFNEESATAREEAARLADRAAKRAAEGNPAKAIGILKRVLEVQPSLYAARRDLAMAYYETGELENAMNHLIELLRLNPTDSWNWVVLANVYRRQKSDPETVERFLRKALEISPNDGWALNGLAALSHEQGKHEEAIALYERSIAAQPEFPNPYFGEAITLDVTGQPDRALGVLTRLFTTAKMQDARSKPVFENSRALYAKIQADLAERNLSEAFKCIQNYKAVMEGLSGYPIRIEETDFEDKVGARIQMAWKHGRDYHLVSTRKGYAPELLGHLEAHELTHLKLEAEARKLGKNLFFATTPKSRETAIRSVEGDFRKWQREGYSEESITKVTLSLIGGLTGFLFNCPLDMLIERHIRENYPALRPAQFLSVRVMAEEAWQTNSTPDVRRLTPKKIMQASLALNGAYALFLDDLFQGASTFAAPYRSLETFGRSQQLWRLWRERSDNLGPGDEYRLVDEFAVITGLRDWYEWKADPGTHQVTELAAKEGTTNAELLEKKHPAAVWHFLDVLKRYDKLPVEKIREIAYEVALAGRNGLDYASPDAKYTLKSLPGESFSGLQLMCMMFAGFKRIAPEHDLKMDLNDPFLTALEMFQSGRDKHGAE